VVRHKATAQAVRRPPLAVRQIPISIVHSTKRFRWSGVLPKYITPAWQGYAGTDGKPYTKVVTNLSNLTLNYNVADINFTSVTSYFDLKYTQTVILTRRVMASPMELFARRPMNSRKNFGW